MPPAPPPDPGLLRALLRAASDFEKEVFPKYPDSELGWLGIVPNITENINSHWSGLAPAGHLRRQPARLDLLHVDDDGPAPALHLPRRCRSSSSSSSSTSRSALMLYWSTTNLWTVGQGLDHAAHGARSRSRRRSARSRTPPKSEPPPPGGDARRTPAADAGATPTKPAGQRPAARAPPQEEGPAGPTVSRAGEQPARRRRRGRGRDGRRGEVDGAPRARAAFPGLDKASVEFAVALRGRARPARRRPGARAGDRHGREAPAARPRRRARSPGRPPRSSASCSSRSARRSARRAGSTSPRTTRASTRR